MDTEGNTFPNSLLGAIVTVVLVVLPLSPAVGGLTSGVLQGPPQREGVKAGGLAGLFAAVPLFLGSLFVVPIVLVAPFGVPRFPLDPIVFVLVALIGTGSYAVGFGIVGGALGSYLADARREQ